MTFKEILKKIEGFNFWSKLYQFSRYYPFVFAFLFVVIINQYSFSSLEAIFYDFRIKYDFGIKFADDVVLITLDEESDEFLGEKYPYTYASHGRLFSKLLKDSPKVVNYFVGLLPPEGPRELEHLKLLRDSIFKFKESGGYFRFGTDVDAWGEQLPPAELSDLGHSLALINVDNSSFSKDDVSRRAILSISGESSLHLWTANNFRSALGFKPLDTTTIDGSYYFREADASFALFRYYTSPLPGNGKVRQIPFHRVLVGNFPKGFFTDKIVLVGPSYVANSNDFVFTPFNKEDTKASKLSVHAQIIESLIQNKTVTQFSKKFTYALTIIIAFILSIVMSRVNPGLGLVVTIGVLITVFITSYFLFSLFGYWIYLTHLMLTIFTVYYIWVPFRAIEEYQRRYAIQEETKLLRKVESLKQNFISLMSHDLKTPVAKIAGIADVLIHKNKHSDELTKGLVSIVDSTKELNKFITSILDLTKIEGQNFKINLVTKDINTVIESVVEDLKFESSSKNTKVEMDLSPLYPIEMDITLIKRVISNIVENAIKYSGDNKAIRIKSWDDNQWVYVEITDNGVGIPTEDLEHIFDKFYRVRNDAAHSIKGSGLGLYLVKYFVELHGGTIIANSKFGEGTTFQIKLKNS